MFRDTFTTPYEQYANHEGQSFGVIRELTDQERDPEVGRMWRIEFEDGAQIDAWPEEVESDATWEVWNGE